MGSSAPVPHQHVLTLSIASGTAAVGAALLAYYYLRGKPEDSGYASELVFSAAKPNDPPTVFKRLQCDTVIGYNQDFQYLDGALCASTQT